MSKRVLILLGIGALALIAAILLLKYELSKPELEEEAEPEEEEEEQEPVPETQDTFTGFKKGFKWDKLSKSYIPIEKDPDLEPEEVKTPV